MRALAWTCGMALACLAATADQAAIVSAEQAESALSLLTPGREIRHYCAPCGDEHWRPEIAAVVETERVEGDGEQVQVKVNGEAVDLAYLYVRQSGAWGNVARMVAAEVSGVPEQLDLQAMEPARGFTPTHFRGKIASDKAILATLTRGGNRISGQYQYGHAQEPIALYGEVKEESGEAVLKEYVDGKKTGEWRVKISRSPFALEGEWVSPDESKKLPLKVSALAVPAWNEQRIEAGGMVGVSSFQYPLFLLSGHPQAGALNAAMAKAMAARREDFVSGLEGSAAEDFLAEMEDAGASMRNWVQEMDSYQLLHCSDRLVSLSSFVYEYTGGAHPNSDSPAYTWVVEGDTLREAKITDFLAKGEESLAVVNAMIIADLKKQEAAYAVDGTLKEFTVADFPAFTVSDRGISVYFPPYAAGPYVQGGFEVALSWKTLAEHGDRKYLANP